MPVPVEKSVKNEVSPLSKVPPSVLPNTVLALSPPDVRISFSNPSKLRRRLLRNSNQPSNNASNPTAPPINGRFISSKKPGSSTGVGGATNFFTGIGFFSDGGLTVESTGFSDSAGTTDLATAVAGCGAITGVGGIVTAAASGLLGDAGVANNELAAAFF